MDVAFLQARIDACQARILRYEEAITAILVNGEQSFSLNTGQTVLSVTQLNIRTIQNLLNAEINFCVTLEARRNGASTHVVPAW